MSNHPKKPPSISALALLLLLTPAPCAPAAQAVPQDVLSAVIKIYTAAQEPNYSDPWSSGPVQASTGSGCIIGDNRILTNAHVVSNQRVVTVRRYGHADRRPARVLFVSHDADLALLAVDDPAFFDGIQPLALGPLPELREEVTVLGYPRGGDSLSATKGILSRVEHISYAHSSQELLGGQVDAAINPGNSGGPVVTGERLVGIAMQNVPRAQNIAYMVPSPVIERFLTDVADGRYDGIPRIGFDWQAMNNEALRRRYKLPLGETGVLVVGTVPGFPAADRLLAGDVLQSIGGYAVANDGTIEFRANERTSFSHVFEQLQLGASVEAAILRGGKKIATILPLADVRSPDRLVPLERYDIRPSYYVFGGLVFRPLSLDYLKRLGDSWISDSAPKLVSLLLGRRPSLLGEQVVIISRVLPAAVNEGYQDISDVVVTTVDAVKPRNLVDLIRMTEENRSPFVTFSYDEGQIVVLDRSKAREATAGILRQYQIARDRQVLE